MSEFLLETRGLVKAFKGFLAVAQVDLKVRRGIIHALIGPNGSGKTTVFNLVTKVLEPTRGRIFFKGKDITVEKPARVASMGIVRSFQISAIFPHLSVLENVRVSLQRKLKNSYYFWESERSLNVLDQRAHELLDAVGLAQNKDMLAVELPYGRKRALEIATTLAMDPELLLLDEPTSGMGHEDVDRITDLIKTVSANRTTLMIEHNLSVVSKLADVITVLLQGEVLAEGDYNTISENPQVKEAYLGTRNE
jgi:branched-chain amino acid transport system ATP-binding protein